VRISNSRISCYRQHYPDPIDDETKQKRLANLTRGDYNGYLSQKTKIKIRDYLHNWIGSVNSHFAGRKQFLRKAGIEFVFVTLTLPATQNHEDWEIKRHALKPFLQQMERVHGWRNWLWVCEVQRNGNLHIHIVGDKRVDHRKLRDLWNGYMNRMGYIQDYRDAQNYTHRNGFYFRSDLRYKWSFQDQLEAYIKGKSENWSNPNSTDIKRIKHVKNLPAYLTKYIAKGNNSRPISGRLWGCSDRIRECTPITISLSSKLKVVFQQLSEEFGSELHCTEFNWTLWRFEQHTLRMNYPVLSEIWSNFTKHCIRLLYPTTLRTRFFENWSDHLHQGQLHFQPVYLNATT